MINFNYEMFSLLLNTSCLLENHFRVLDTYTTYYIADFTRVFIPSENLTTLMLEFNDTYVWNQCLLDISFEYIFTANLNCKNESTNISPYPAWHLDQINHDLDQLYQYPEASEAVELWVLDTGVNTKHQEFDLSQVINEDPGFNMTHPHGTGVSSAASGLKYGTSKHIKIHSLPVCRYSGTCASSDIEKGLQTMLQVTAQNQQNKKRTVINMSFGTPLTSDPNMQSLGQYLNTIFETLERQGAILVTSAGNSHVDACNWLYSFSPFIISVGSINSNYSISTFSNYGHCVDLYAFGYNVPVAYSLINPSYYQYVSGTSFAAPLVAGMVVNLLLQNNTWTRPQIVPMLREQLNQLPVAEYKCGQEELQCCRSSLRGTRLDRYCRGLGIEQCARNCIVGRC